MKKSIYAFVDASNLFYGGEKSLGWKIDYKKLIRYIKKQYKVSKVYYYGGVETDGFSYSVLDKKPLNLNSLINYLRRKIKQKRFSVLEKHIQRVKFYRKLAEFGYNLRLKPVKIYRDEEGKTIKKANCDVDMTFDLMRLFKEYLGVLILSGDGDFAVVLKYLKEKGKKVTILARGERTAREIRQLVGGDFRDFSKLRTKLEFLKK
ncbi:MAG: NYN domain-containing protein [Patescibacteria group bacterium]